MALAPDGRLVAVGSTVADTAAGDFAVLRHNPDGSLDASFGGDGLVTTDFGGSNRARGVVLQSDGKIVAAGSGGPNADFALARYAFAESDLARTKNQQKFLSALASQAATPGTILNPFKLYPTLGAGLDTLIVDKEMSLFDLGEMFFAMKGISGGDGTSMNMPTSGSQGGNLVWDKAKVQQLVKQIQNDEKVTVSDK
ncbi:hypothetical protein GCM10010271_28530 [Streptomyces kurssanovii]|nr:hypothetical protein GCM10010271_28530 [Streptomyces kurssanovii]